MLMRTRGVITNIKMYATIVLTSNLEIFTSIEILTESPLTGMAALGYGYRDAG